MGTAKNTYPALQYPASDLSAFAVCIDMFIISLKNGEIIHFTPDNVQRFYDWLIDHSVRDVQNEAIVRQENIATPSVGLFKRIMKIFIK
ncbi:hypothetical protein [Flavobacterium ginsenosidimutans]|uniref:Uncharacterized protein n=1 Tax=Flavobacterium ginsenosidimutans TaxID=687844 RepID=A0ABZ2Q2X7_9FLAO